MKKYSLISRKEEKEILVIEVMGVLVTGAAEAEDSINQEIEDMELIAQAVQEEKVRAGIEEIQAALEEGAKDNLLEEATAQEDLAEEKTEVKAEEASAMLEDDRDIDLFYYSNEFTC